jgi:hypothetical protein
MKQLILLAALLLGSCEPGQGSDGYAFGRCPLNRTSFTVTMAFHPTIADLRRAADRVGASIESGREAFAWGTFSPSRPVCSIHVIAPQNQWRPERWGHELAHCACGSWHR